MGTEPSLLDVQDRKLLWSDEFDGTELDMSNWSYALGDGCPNLCGWGNNERQLYTEDNHHFADGKLVITVEKDGDEYTSTRLLSQGKQEFKYGYIETRAKVPTGHGIWPAFWMLGTNIDEVGWPLCGEIDVMEYVGRKPDEVFTTLHTKANHGDDGSSRITPYPSIEEGFHTFGVDWTAEQMEFFVDGKSVFVFDPKERTEEVWPFDQPFYLLLNVAVGGNFGGPEVDDTIFPQQFIVDYVRVYEPKE
ncbi:laminarinase [Lewinella sp. 4G2]|nr:laminarinase [Lewinella sp. 4G2]